MSKLKLVVVVIATLTFVLGAGVMLKTFVLNKPSMSPQEVVRKYIDNINEGNRDDNTQYVTDNFMDEANETEDEENNDDTKVITTFKEERLDGNKATVVHEIDAGIMKVNFEFKLKKEGSWLKGYSWKIDDVITPDFGNTEEETSAEDANWIDASMNEEIQLATVKYIVLNSEEKTEIQSKYDFDDEVLKASEGNKFIIINFKVENTTKQPINISSRDLFTLIDSQDRQYNEYSGGLYSYFENLLLYEELNPNVPFTGYTVFEVPESLSSYGVASCKSGSVDCYIVEVE